MKSVKNKYLPHTQRQCIQGPMNIGVDWEVSYDMVIGDTPSICE